MRTVAIVAAILALAIVPAASAQLTPEQEQIIRSAPPGSTFTFQFEKDDGTITTQQEASGKGAGLKSSADVNVGEFNSSAPTSNLGDIGAAMGATTQSTWKLEQFRSLWSNPCIWAGIACLLGAGAVLWFMRAIRLAAIIAGIGLALILVAVMPGLVFFAFAAVGVVLLWPMISAELGKLRNGAAAAEATVEAKRQNEAVRALVAAVSDLGNPKSLSYNPTVHEVVIKAIRSHVEQEDKAVIAETKRADDLP